MSSRPVVARRNFTGLIAGAAVSTLVATGLIAAAAYSGGVDGLAPTKPSEGDQLNSQRRAVIDYADYLEARQNDVAASVGADVGYSYTVSINAFSADLNVRQAASLQSDKRVVALDRDELLKLLEVVTGEPAPVATVMPKITGKPAIGKILRSSTGTWDVKGLTFAYQWSVGGVAVVGATSSTYTVVAANQGAKVTVTVTATGDGVPAGTATSAPVTVAFGT